MFRTANPDPRNEGPDDRRRDRTVFAPGRPGPAPAWQPMCARRAACAITADNGVEPKAGYDASAAPSSTARSDASSAARSVTRSAPPSNPQSAAEALPPRVPLMPHVRTAGARYLLVPVHTTSHGTDVVRFFQDPVGHRVAVAFTSVALLRNVCGADQRWTEMAEECLRETIAGHGVGTIVRDPRLGAAPVKSAAPGTPRPPAA
ncbi:SAV_915 family protein [Streptodolium elevatio]